MYSDIWLLHWRIGKHYTVTVFEIVEDSLLAPESWNVILLFHDSDASKLSSSVLGGLFCRKARASYLYLPKTRKGRFGP